MSGLVKGSDNKAHAKDVVPGTVASVGAEGRTFSAVMEPLALRARVITLMIHRLKRDFWPIAKGRYRPQEGCADGAR